jgi:hypothetical protein
VDLGTEWRARRWRKLMNLIDQLPRDSRYVEAQLQDEDLAQVLVALPTQVAARRLSEWSPELEVLVTATDRLADIVNVLLLTNGGTAVRFTPAARPQTAADRLKARHREQQHTWLVDRLIPPSAEGASS